MTYIISLQWDLGAKALSSICAVAKVEIITKTAEAETGVHYIVDHGICGEADEIACADGTIMIVEDLFLNVPARMKFLKKHEYRGRIYILTL